MGERNGALDGFRALAALAVLFFHARMPGFRGGFIGVDVFFVLSGYLITAIIREEIATSGSFDYRRFMTRRIKRLYPALLLLLIAFVACAPWLFPKAAVWQEAVLSGSYLSNYSRALYRVPVILQHTWSLAVEMQFYLLWPFVIIVLCRNAPEYASALLMSVFVGITVWRYLVFRDGGVAYYYRLDTRVSGLVLGGAIAFYVWPMILRYAGPLGILSSIMLLAGVVLLRFESVESASWAGALVELCAASVIISALTPGTIVARAFGWRPLAVLGLWSYSIYLWHYPIARLTRVEFGGMMSTLITLAITLPLAAVTYRFVETRFYARRRRADLAPA